MPFPEHLNEFNSNTGLGSWLENIGEWLAFLSLKSGELRKAKGWEVRGDWPVKCKALFTAETGQRGESGTSGMGRCTTLSLNCMGFLHCTVTKAPKRWKLKSECYRCLKAMSDCGELTGRWLFWSILKKWQQACHSQKDALKLVCKPSWDWMLNRMLGAIGNFWVGRGGSPLNCLIPIDRDCNGQLYIRGFGD